jgi:ribonucleoside-diphosphate reductase alpha chain
MDRPKEGVPCITVKKKTGCGNMYITSSTLPDYPEVFIRHGKTGGCQECWCQAMGRVISFTLRFRDATLEERRERVIHALKDIRCPNPMHDGNIQHLSCPDAIARAMEDQVWDKVEDKPDEES